MYILALSIKDHKKMQKSNLINLRSDARAMASACEDAVLESLISNSSMTLEERASAECTALNLVESLRKDNKPGLMEVFLAEYGLSTDEGIALMCLAEALLRVPDSDTIDDLIEDKISSSSWGEHLGKSSSSLVNAATWGLLFTGKVLNDNQKNGVASSLRGAIKRLGEPVIRIAVKRAMKEMGRQFVLGESIEGALERGQKRVSEGYSYSFDMLGEAALTQADADKYRQSYEAAIDALNAQADTDNVKDNPGISIKLSALHPRYELNQHERVINELIPIVLKLAQKAKSGNIGLNIDAEEADRLDLSLDVIQGVLEDSSLAGWDGFGVVVQAYNRSAGAVLDWLYALAKKNDRRIMVRLVKGAYWDTEIKRAQVEGLRDYPVFTRKAATDISYLCCAKKLLSMNDRVYPQFATHNAHTAAAVLAIADVDSDYEFQRLHGMGEGVFRLMRAKNSVRCRIYAPVGRHKDLLAYLVRRLLENGANSSFVNQIVDLDVPVSEVVSDPFEAKLIGESSPINLPKDLFQPERVNSRGWDLHDYQDKIDYQQSRAPFAVKKWHATPLTVEPYQANSSIKIVNPADCSDVVGDVVEALDQDVDNAISAAKPWSNKSAVERSIVLQNVALLLEENAGEVFALLTREAGKTPQDAVAEVREAVDFLRYYSAQAEQHQFGLARGIFVCISPWNFPLAIFIGQMSAALAAGNAVLAKPAEATPLIAFLAVKLFHQAGVPRHALQLLPGQGANIGAKLVSAPTVNGVCFTGSTATGLRINRSMAKSMHPNAPLIAETGGLNAMIVDSTALPEQAIADIVSSSFQSAGQRCSALRLLYVQEDIYNEFLTMLYGAIDELKIGKSWDFSTDVGPLISASAHQHIQAYVDAAAAEGRLLKSVSNGIPVTGHFIGPAVINVNSINDMDTEIFGPVLHIAKFKAGSIDSIVEDINASGYGLTFGLHTRIDSRVEHLVNKLNVGNIYINRDQIGAVVGSQPFGGENLSGTGPKAGGPNYILQFMQPEPASHEKTSEGVIVTQLSTVQAALDSFNVQRVKLSEDALIGPTGESNILYEYGRGVVLCLGVDLGSAQEQARIANTNGCHALIVCPGAKGENSIDGFLSRELLTALNGFDVVALWSDDNDASLVRRSLSIREGKIIALVSDKSLARACRLERHVCVDTTAAGGNASLLASSI